jgi:hypothetical protein
VYSNHVGIDNELTIKDLQVYPNPSNGSFTVSSQSMNADKLEIEVADIQGKVVYSADLGKVSGFIHAIHLPNVAKGVYLLKITTGTQSHFSKLVVE